MEAIGPDEDQIPVDEASELPEFGLAWLKDELVSYAGKQGNWLVGATRGMFGTTPMTHGAGELVRIVSPEETFVLTSRGIFEGASGVDWNRDGVPNAADLTCAVWRESCLGEQLN